MGSNRTITQSRDDLKAAADAIPSSFKTTFEREPTEITTSQLPLFCVLDGTESGDELSVDSKEAIYNSRYEFDIVMVLDASCAESEVITARNAWVQKLVSQTQTNGYRPFTLERWRHYLGHWGHVKGWFVTMTLSRYTIEDFLT